LGLWEWFKDAIFTVLKFLAENMGDNWGLAIIVLTVMMRLALTPLIVKQTRSMYELQRIQPKIKALQEKYKNNKEKLQEETLKFYQENKVNPFGGCLPLIIQMPIFIALFSVLRVGTDPSDPTKGAGAMITYLHTLSDTAYTHAVNFFGIIPDISLTPKLMWTQGFVEALPYLLLVIMFGLSVWIPQLLMPGEKQQKMLGMYMGLMMLYFGWVSPAGVLLYWVTSSVLGIAQQQVTMKLAKRHEEALT